MSRPASFVSADGLLLDAVAHDPVGERRGTVLLVHGITADRDEGGFFTAMAERLADEGFAVLRFSFRGHGRSEGSPRGVTIAGEMLDLLAAVDQLRDDGGEPVDVVAASFGAVSLCLAASMLDGAVGRVALVNPVLDLRATFLEPEGDWGRLHFGPCVEEALRRGEPISVGGFELGPVLLRELQAYDVGPAFLALDSPVLVLHGDADSAVPYGPTRDIAQLHPRCELVTVPGADHGFANVEDGQAGVIERVASWLAAPAAVREGMAP